MPLVPLLFRVKICGITTVNDAIAAVTAGADAIGLNFYAPSPRCVTITQARVIANAVRDHAVVVGVFVNHTAEAIEHTASEVGLGAIQLHGDEPPEIAGQLPALPYYRAWRAVGDASADAQKRFAELLLKPQPPPAALLVDAPSVGYGGSGKRVEMSALTRVLPHDRQQVWPWWMILAGGLNAENVGAAIAEVPDYLPLTAVDVASGVETAPGEKDMAAMQAFVTAARIALEQR